MRWNCATGKPLRLRALRMWNPSIVLAGEGLHIVKLNLDDGVLEAEGRILALEYADEPKMGKKGFLSGLFK